MIKPLSQSIFFAVLLCIAASAKAEPESESGPSVPLSTLSDVLIDQQDPSQRQNILETLRLSETQKLDIQTILLAGMQSLDAVNAQLGQFEVQPQEQLSADAQQMVADLKQQRIQLAEMMSVEILSILSTDQRAKLNLTSELPTTTESRQPSIREYEL